MTVATHELCVALPWDSTFFGVETARVVGDTLTPEGLREVDAWCAARKAKWLYFLARSDDDQTSRVAQEGGFRLVDVRVTLERQFDGGPVPAAAAGVEPFAEADLPALQEIARTAFADSRFYHDGRIPRGKCDELYVVWTTKSCRSPVDRVLVVRDGEGAAGFVSCRIGPEPGWGSIGLIGVAARARGQGVGRRLVEAAVAWGAERGLAGMTVVTQGRNLGAQRLYERGGFITRSVQLYYHKWYE